MAFNPNPTSDLIRRGDLEKLGGFLSLWRPRHFKLYRNGILDRYKPEDNSTPTKRFIVVEFIEPEESEKTEGILKIKCLHPRRSCRPFVAERKLRVLDPKVYALWCSNLRDVANRDAVMETEWEETVQPPAEMESGPSGSNTKVDRLNFQFVKMLGSGTYGRVWLCKKKDSDKYYALKKLNKRAIVRNQQFKRTQTESRVLFKSDHPFLTSMAFAFHNGLAVFFVMDYCIGGDLFSHLHEFKTPFGIEGITFYAAEIACALQYLHSNDVVFRDLKPENVLFDKEGHIKIVDFGLCKENMDHETRTSTFCGTPAYMAPEVVKRNEYGRAVDWWALGAIVYEMIYHRPPFFVEDDNKDRPQLFKLITTVDPKFPAAACHGSINEVTQDFLTGLLKKDPEQRLGGKGFAELEKHPFFEDIDWKNLPNETPPFVPVVKNDEDTKYFDKEGIYQLNIKSRDDPIVLYPDHPESPERNFHHFSIHEQPKNNNIPENYVMPSDT